MGSVKYIQNSKLLVVGEYRNTVQVFRTTDYAAFSEIKFKGGLVGFDTSSNEEFLYVGISSYTPHYVPGGILEYQVSQDGFKRQELFEKRGTSGSVKTTDYVY